MFSSAACHDSAAQAEVKLPKIFGDNMVLQQQTECNLRGTADANKVVKVCVLPGTARPIRLKPMPRENGR